MSPEERRLLEGVFDRMRNNASAPRDREADQMIADNVRSQPYSPYFLTQTVIVQEQALQAANQRIKDLEQQAQQSQPAQSSGSGGFLSSIFGGGSSQPPAPAQRPPVWNQGGAAGQAGGFGQSGPYGAPPPQQQGGPWGGAPQQGGGGGGGFLHGALQTAAGVAGGALLFDGIRGLMGGHGSPFGIGAGTPGGGGETVVNNYYGDSGGGGIDSGPADWAQDADQDQDAAQDAADYGVDDNTFDT